MSKTSAAGTNLRDAVENPAPTIEALSQPTVVITEQEIVFSTAAAAALPRTTPTRGVIGALRAMFRHSVQDAQPTPRHYPPCRAAFLERAAMTREMRRLSLD